MYFSQACLKTEKLRISKSIVAAIREISGRFLEREDGKTSQSLDEKDENGNPVTWKDIGDKRAIEKTSQALREGQPKLLKKLAQQQGGCDTNNMMQTNGANAMQMNGNYGQMGGMPPQSMLMPQYSNMPQSMPGNYQQMQGGAQMFHHSSQQNNFQPQGQRGSFTPQQLAALVEGQTFDTFPRNSFVENGLSRMGTESSIGIPSRSGTQTSNHESWHDSWGSEDPAPLRPSAIGRGIERSNSRASTDSWGDENPMPLPYHEGVSEGAFSKDDHAQLMNCLGVDGGVDGNVAKPDAKRPSVKFQLEPHGRNMSASAMSLTSHLSELSIFSSDALSLDSAMDAAQREAEFDMLGEFDAADFMSIGTFDSPDLSGSGRSPLPRRSILRKSSYKTTTNALPPASLNRGVDPGLIFTSTLDSKPGGVNAGMDVSGLLTERRKSVVAFEIDVKRRRSSRLSMLSAMTDMSGLFKRDIGSFLSIQSTDFRELMEDIDSDSDGDNGDDAAEGKQPIGK